LLESISDNLVKYKGDKGTAFEDMVEVFDGLKHCQELAVVRTVLLLSPDDLMGVESQGLASVADTLLQNGANSSIRSVCK
jgi:hypothetical protein